MEASNSIKLTQQEKHCLITMSKQAIQQHYQGLPFSFPPQPTSDTLLQTLACFVTLTINGKLRGCIGTYQHEKALWQNVYQYAFSSAFEDRRFLPLQISELKQLMIEISVLSPLQELPNKGEKTLIKQLEVGVDGLLLEDDKHRAIFLPTVWQSIPDASRFVQHLKQKANWPQNYWSKDIKVQQFTTLNFSDFYCRPQGK